MTIKDIAERVGITKASVSYVLNGKDSNVSIGEVTKRKIFQAAWDMGYKTHDNVMLLLPFLSSSDAFYLDAVLGVYNVLLKSGLNSMIKISEHNDALTEKIIDETYEQRLARGFIFIESLPEKVERKLVDLRIPFVVINPLRETEFNNVICDDNTGMRLLLEHCLERGYSKMSLLGKNEHWYQDAPWHAKREAEYDKFCKNNDIEVKKLFFEPSGIEPYVDELIAENGKQVLINNYPSNLEIAFRLEHFHKRYPKDIGLVSMCSPISEVNKLNLTFLKIPIYDMAEKAAGMIMRMIESGELKIPSESSLPELVDRGSC